ncbi:MAG: hypothetical protein GY793_03200 [Proteobacteria bacterium]|nr:hypothetical protein [Pseudomonadota bacterium]
MISQVVTINRVLPSINSINFFTENVYVVYICVFALMLGSGLSASGQMTLTNMLGLMTPMFMLLILIANGKVESARTRSYVLSLLFFPTFLVMCGIIGGLEACLPVLIFVFFGGILYAFDEAKDYIYEREDAIASKKGTKKQRFKEYFLEIEEVNDMPLYVTLSLILNVYIISANMPTVF